MTLILTTKHDAGCSNRPGGRLADYESGTDAQDTKVGRPSLQRQEATAKFLGMLGSWHLSTPRKKAWADPPAQQHKHHLLLLRCRLCSNHCLGAWCATNAPSLGFAGSFDSFVRAKNSLRFAAVISNAARRTCFYASWHGKICETESCRTRESLRLT